LFYIDRRMTAGVRFGTVLADADTRIDRRRARTSKAKAFWLSGNFTV
jgi:hypothetical protein